MQLNILVALWISIFSSLQISQNKLKNENQFQVQVQQNGDQAKKTSSVKDFCSLQVIFTLQDQKTSRLSAPDQKMLRMLQKKQNKITKKKRRS